MGRFYRHVLIEKNFPHHGAVAFGHYGKALYEVFKVCRSTCRDINFNQPKGDALQDRESVCISSYSISTYQGAFGLYLIKGREEHVLHRC